MYTYTGLLSKVSGGIIYTARTDMIDWSEINERCGEEIDASVGIAVPSKRGIDSAASSCINMFHIPEGACFGLTWDNPNQSTNCSGVVVYQNVDGNAERFMYP